MWGSRLLLEAGSAGISQKDVDQGVEQALKEAFRPEFLNRIDEVITFHALTRENIMAIASLQIEALNNRLAARNPFHPGGQGCHGLSGRKRL